MENEVSTASTLRKQHISGDAGLAGEGMYVIRLKTSRCAVHDSYITT